MSFEKALHFAIFDLQERFWEQCIFKYLRAEPEDHYFLLVSKIHYSSGLKINPTKSEAIWLGKWKNREDTPFNFKWPKESVFVLGVHFSNC